MSIYSSSWQISQEANQLRDQENYCDPSFNDFQISTTCIFVRYFLKYAANSEIFITSFPEIAAIMP